MPISVVECFAGTDLTEPRLSPDGHFLAYVRSDARESRIVVRRLDRKMDDMVSSSLVRAGRGLNGGSFDWMPNSASLVIVSVSGELRIWDLQGDDHLLVAAAQDRVLSSPAPSPDGTRVAYVLDQAEIHVLDVTSRASRRVDDGEMDFVLDPVWWRDVVVWQAWASPHMPWDESVLVTADGRRIGRGGCQHQQPQTSLVGHRIGWLDDGNGWLNLAVDGFGRVEENREHGGPTWGERQRSWCLESAGDHAAFVRNESGFGRLCTVDLRTGAVVERAKAVHGQLSWRGNVLAALRTGGRTPTQIVVYDTRDEQWERSTIEVGPAHAWSECRALVEPELVRVPTSGPGSVDLHARLYSSPGPRGRLLCWIHGGPTDQWQVTFQPRFVYWLDRGYDVLVPDFRGSTGHGRDYTRALNGQWGIRDVDDVGLILDHVAARSGYSRQSIAVIGSSAGGLTALALLARHGGCAAGAVVAYPVSDIAALDATTHRFEAHYNRSLVGTLEATLRLSRERSPIMFVDELSHVPLLVFHGSADRVVPVEQSDRFIEKLRGCGSSVEYVVFDGEGHGFRSLEHRIREFDLTENFLERILRT